jgi:hypothetical protein
LENPLAQKLLAGDYLPGQVILTDVEHAKLTFGVALKH